ncbi:MAG: hypothetical protein HZC49_01775 [Nitrospirae bacterium]|nr:hypothetical protein [Nitrospirota bacterium]
MGKIVAVSFEGDRLKIVHATLNGRKVTVDSTDIIPDSDLDSYLKADKSAEYIVTCEFRRAYHGVLSTPAVKSGYMGKLIESKIRKSSGEKDFTFIYSILGERVVENRKEMEVFYYAVNNADLKAIAGRFYDNGKKVKAIYPSVFSAVALINPEGEGEGRMGVFGAGSERTIFLTKNGAVNFIRNYESHDKGLTDYDIQNINMTLTYCFQNLRMNPSSVLLMGDLSASQDIGALPSVPLSGLSMSGNIYCSREIYDEFVLPVGACLALGPSNILSREFKNINMLKTYIAYASMLFITLAVLCMGLIFNEANDIAGKKHLVDSAVKNMSDIESIFSEYAAREEEVNRYRPAVTFLNRPTPDIHKMLVSLGGTNAGNLIFDSIEARTDESNSLIVEINGTSHEETYSSLQSSLKDLVDALGKTKNMKVTNKSIDLAKYTFKIEMNYGTE